MGDVSIPKFIDELDDSTLRAELVKNGVPAGPITPTTRRILKRRLAKKLGAVAAFQTSQDQDSNDDDAKSALVNQETSKITSHALDSLGKGNSSSASNNNCVSTKQQFFGVFLPKADCQSDTNEHLVFESQSNALLVVKDNKNARFKVFDSFEDARKYSVNGAEEPVNSESSSAVVTEEVENQFPSLRQVDLNQLLRNIENGDLDQVRNLIWSNPKYLISSADGPVVLKASARYNALHIAAKANQPEICREILSVIQNPEFQALIFPNVADEIVNSRRTEHLLDSYLNTPEKILYETPLHFACKMGYKDVVAELVSYSQCSTSVMNKSGKTPREVTCSRSSTNIPSNQAEIHQLLDEQYYVPLLRYCDNSEHAIVGDPITSKQHSEECKISKLTNGSESPLQSSLAVSALAGPMPKDVAARFQKSWRTPSKCKGLGKPLQYLRRADSEKGDEQIGRQLAEKEHVGWVEYWDFITDFANFATEEGLMKLEAYLRENTETHIGTLQNPKESISQDISQLASILQGIRLDRSSENICQNNFWKNKKKQSLDSDQSQSSGSQSSYHTAPEHISPSDTLIFTTPKPIMNRTEQCGQSAYTLSTDSADFPGNESKLVKKLFADNSVENMVDNFAKSLSLKPQNGETSDIWFENDASSVYRSADKSSSDVFSSPSQSDTSMNSSISDYPQKVNPVWIFLAGPEPTKLDQDVLLAIGDAEIDFQKFPNISKWKSAVLSYSENARQKWATPRKERSFSFSFNHNSSLSNGHPSLLSPNPSSSYSRLQTPNQDMRRFLYKPFMPPYAR